MFDTERCCTANHLGQAHLHNSPWLPLGQLFSWVLCLLPPAPNFEMGTAPQKILIKREGKRIGANLTFKRKLCQTTPPSVTVLITFSRTILNHSKWVLFSFRQCLAMMTIVPTTPLIVFLMTGQWICQFAAVVTLSKLTLINCHHNLYLGQQFYKSTLSVQWCVGVESRQNSCIHLIIRKQH